MKLIKGFCPNCGGVIYYAKGQTTVLCPCCDCEVSPSVSAPSDAGFEGAGTGAVSGLTFDNSDSALVFLENFFDNYDWTEYQQTTDIPLSEIAKMIESHKIKNGSSAVAWYLDFKALSVPVAKKIEGLGALAKKLCDKYDPEDYTDALEVFDHYKKIANTLNDAKLDIFKRLENSVKYAERFELDAVKLDEMKNDLQSLETDFDSKVKEIKQLDDIASFAEVKAEKDREKADALESKGIYADQEYQTAVACFESNNIAEALAKFELIKGYKDSVEYIGKINKYFSYHNELIMFANKTFMFKWWTPTSFNVAAPVTEEGKKVKDKKKKPKVDKKKEDGKPQENAPKAFVPKLDFSTGYRMYEVVNGEMQADHLVGGIIRIIENYGNFLYYFKKNGIYCFDVKNRVETQLDKGTAEDYKVNGEYYIKTTRSGSTFFFRKKLVVGFEKLGCIAKLMKKKPKVEARNNNYQISTVDMKTNTTSVIIPELVDIADYYENSLFFVHAKEGEKVKKPGLFKRLLNKILRKKIAPVPVVTELQHCDLKTGELSSVLDAACEIHNVANGKIIYTKWAPNEFNRDLYAYDLVTGKETLIEDNVLEYYTTIRNYVYYLVGTQGNAPLIRASLDGEDRSEIMKNVAKVVGIRGNWIYILKGSGHNTVLLKMSADGKQLVFITSLLKEIKELNESYIYYIDTYNRFCVVRVDGKENHVIAENMADNMIVVAKDCVFFCRQEKVGEGKEALSLYKMDLDGRNVKKLVFDFDKISNYDDEVLYYSTVKKERFKVSVPQGPKKPDEVHYEYHTITKYYRYYKNTKHIENFLTLGMPHGSTHFKQGCLKKKDVEKEIVYTLAPIVNSYKREGLAKAGATTAETVRKQQQ